MTSVCNKASVLRMLSGALEDEDGEFAELLRRLSLVKVNVFEAGELFNMVA